MKPKEIMDSDLTYCYSVDKSTLIRYYEKDCVIAYNQCFGNCLFIIKGKNKCFIYYSFCKGFMNNVHGCILTRRVELRDFINIIKGYEDKLTIIDKEEYTKFKRQIIMGELNGDN